MNDIRVFAGATGLNTVADPARIPPTKDAFTDLQAVANMTITSLFRINRRKGLSLLESGVYHSLFQNKGDAFVCKTTSLYRIGSDLSLTGVRSGLSGAWLDYAQVGDLTYYANGFDRGYVSDGTSYVWGAGTYTGPDSNRQFDGPVSGNHLSFAMGRMFISEGNVVWYSEPYDCSLYNKAECFFQFPSKVLMLKPVDEGLFISDETSTWFCRGAKPSELTAVKVASFPAIEWTVATEYVPGFEIGLEEPRLCAIWCSPEGVIAGLPSGAVYNLNKNKIIYPETARRGFGCLTGYNYIHGME